MLALIKFQKTNQIEMANSNWLVRCKDDATVSNKM